MMQHKRRDTAIRLVSYQAERSETLTFHSSKEMCKQLSEDELHWIDIAIDNERHNIEDLASFFKIHPLTVEDIYNTKHLPKWEEFDDYLLLTLKMISIGKPHQSLPLVEQVSIVLGKGYVLTIQETNAEDVFDRVRMRLVNGRGKIRVQGSDYLFFQLIDAVVDNYLYVLERYRERINLLEDYIVKHENKNSVARVLALKKEIDTYRKYIVPLMQEVNDLLTNGSPLIEKSSYVYLKDIYDHLAMANSAFEVFREMLKDLIDLNMSYLSHNMNNIMKTLTVLTAIFIPLTFIVGIYGMNFDVMPELRNPSGYYMVWGAMLSVAFGMIIFMRSRRWL